MARYLEQRRVRVIGNSNRECVRRSGFLQGTDRERSRAACRDAYDDIVGADLRVDHGLCAGDITVFGALDAPDKRVNATRHGKYKSLSGPIISWGELGAVLYTNAP